MHVDISISGEFYKDFLDKTIIIKNLVKSNNDILLKGFKYLSNYSVIEASVSGQQGYKQGGTPAKTTTQGEAFNGASLDMFETRVQVDW